MGSTDLFTFKCSTIFFNSLRSALARNPDFLDLFIDPEGDCRIQLEAEVKVQEPEARVKVRVNIPAYHLPSQPWRGRRGASPRAPQAWPG